MTQPATRGAQAEYCCEALSVSLVGMNADMMAEYIRFIADRLLIALGYEKLYRASNPFDWMEMISLQCVSDTLLLSSAFLHTLLHPLFPSLSTIPHAGERQTSSNGVLANTSGQES